jgi:hypothetical protein
MSSSESETEEPKQSIEKQRPPAQQAKAKKAMSEKQLAVLASARAKRLENCAAQRRAREEASEPVIDAVPSAGAQTKPTKRVSRKPTRRTVVHVPPPADDSESSSEEEIVYVQAPRRKKKVAKKKKKRVVVQAPPSSSSEESSSSDDEPAQPSAATNLYRTMRWV